MNSENEQPMPEAALQASRAMPYSKWWALLAGVLAGLLLRLVFSGRPGGPYSAMAGAFIYLAPLAVGAVTVFVAERQRPRSWGYDFRVAALANLLFVLGTLAVMIEGLICAVVIAPLFMLIGGLGGLLMGLVCRRMIWPRTSLYSIVALPMLLGALGGAGPAEPSIGSIERSRVIEAPAAAVWREIHDARDIRPEEVERAWMYRIGVPLPHSGVTQETAQGRVRRITMGKAIHFEQVVQAWEENRHVRWSYRFEKDSIPPGALDDHVAIGGQYFDLLDTAYTLTPVGGGGATRLAIRMDYRLCTDFNWYARWVADLLIGNFEEVILGFYARRAEPVAQR